jgi:predicted RNA-binding protein (virulence factor B family)
VIEIGRNNRLKAVRKTANGMYLGIEEEVVLLPNTYVPADLIPGNEIDVFVYLDSEERIVATTLEPKLKLNEFGVLEVKQINKAGAFLDWGLEKDLMVPFSEQQRNMKPGQKYLVYLYLDPESNRLVASSKVEKFVEKDEIALEPGQEVELLIGETTNIGINVIINNLYKGLLFRNEIFRPIEAGERTKGYIKALRNDRKIDVTLQPIGYKNIIVRSEENLLQKLKENNGFLPLTDKSGPASVMEAVQMSKKTFKKALGALYKKKLVDIEEKGIRLK